MIKVKKTIGIDARFYGPIGKGLGRYTQEIVDHLVADDQEHDYVIFLSKHNFRDFNATGTNVKKVLADVHWYSLAEQFILPVLILRHGIDLMHFPHFNVPVACPVKFIVTIHDLILTKYPTVRATTLSPWFYQLKNLAYKFVIWQAVKRAEKIITVSKFTKKDIINHFKISSKQVIVTYEGVANLSKGRDDLFSSPADSAKYLAQLKINKDYLLYVGNAYPHKNLERLIIVAKDLCQHHDLQLVLVGKIDYFYQRLVDEVNNWPAVDRTKVVFAGYVSDLELEILYNKALVYVFPSLYEGFGLPPLEAMARHCPVVSSDRSSMPEILGQAAVYFDPEDNCDMAQKLETVITDQVLRQKMIAEASKQVKRYDWWECSQATLKVYQEVL